MTPTTPRPEDQREDLEKSFERSTEQQPETYRGEATDDKVVEIGRDKTKAPIRGIDAPESSDAPNRDRERDR
jgi:hypothetical protein